MIWALGEKLNRTRSSKIRHVKLRAVAYFCVIFLDFGFYIAQRVVLLLVLQSRVSHSFWVRSYESKGDGIRVSENFENSKIEILERDI